MPIVPPASTPPIAVSGFCTGQPLEQFAGLAPLPEQAQPILDALVVQPANAPLLHRADTMRILDLRRPGSATADKLALLAPRGKGTSTSNVLALRPEPHPEEDRKRRVSLLARRLPREPSILRLKT